MEIYKLIQGDCLDILKEIPDNSIDFIFADPPYGTTSCKWDSVIDLELLWRQLKRVRKDNTAIVLFAQTPFDKVLGFSNIKELKYEWIWEKTQATGYLNAKKMPMKAHENLLVFYKNRPNYYPIISHGHTRKVASSEARNKCIEKRLETYGDDYIYGKESKTKGYDSTDRMPRDVLKFKKDTQKSTIHRTQKPLDLVKYILNTYCKQGDTVLDFCYGSNTTGVACKDLALSYIGIEKDEEMFLKGKNRMNGNL